MTRAGGTIAHVRGDGYFAVFAVFVLLHVHAYRKREMLELNTVERFDTISSILESGLNCGIALTSIGIVLVGGPRYSGLAGVIYMLTGVVMAVHGYIMGSRRGKLVKQIESEEPTAALEPEMS